MTTLAQIRKQIEELQQRAEEIAANERQQAIDEIKAKMAEYDITPADLGISAGGGGRGRGRPSGPGAKRQKAAAKYRGPQGETWGGGRGRKPEWVRAVLAKGEDLESYRVR